MIILIPASSVVRRASPFLLAGIAVGHVYYFLEDVFPKKPGGFQILKTPRIL